MASRAERDLSFSRLNESLVSILGEDANYGYQLMTCHNTIQVELTFLIKELLEEVTGIREELAKLNQKEG